MTTSKSLPARPSLESLRKQAKKLARDASLSHRGAQLALAREYGFSGWQELIAEVHRRLGHGLEWAVSRARQIIHNNDVKQLKQLLTEHPALLSWQGEKNEGGLLGMATSAYSDAGAPEQEQLFTRPDCAELLIDTGAILLPSVCESIVHTRAKGLLRMFERKGLLPRTLKFRVALEDLDGVRALIDSDSLDFATVNEAFHCACRFENETLASVLLDRLTVLDAELGRHIDAGPGRAAFLKGLTDDKGLLAFMDVGTAGPWQTFVMRQIVRSLHDDDVTAFVRHLRDEPSLLGESSVGFQVGLIERAILRDRGAFIVALLDLDPAMLRCRPPPRSQAFEFAFTCVKQHLLPILTRIWQIPDDLPHAAGIGDFDRVKAWFDPPHVPHVQQVLDTALAWAVLQHHFEIADFLLQNGADINTTWGSHEPASILHELTFHRDYDGMRFLIDRGIDMMIEDYRWGGTAEDWAYHACKDFEMAQWLAAAAQKRGTNKRVDESPPE